MHITAHIHRKICVKKGGTTFCKDRNAEANALLAINFVTRLT